AGDQRFDHQIGRHVVHFHVEIFPGEESLFFGDDVVDLEGGGLVELRTILSAARSGDPAGNRTQETNRTDSEQRLRVVMASSMHWAPNRLSHFSSNSSSASKRGSRPSPGVSGNFTQP